jgi:hypothetical protein
LVVPLDAAVVAFVGANNVGKSAALKAFYELKPLWQMCEPQTLVQVYGKNPGVGQFLEVKDQAKVFSHEGGGPLRIDWIFSEPDKSKDLGSVMQRIRFELNRVTRALKTEMILGNGEAVPAQASISWNKEGESFVWATDRPAATAFGYEAASHRFGQARFVPAMRTLMAVASGQLYDAQQGAAMAAQWADLKNGDASGGHANAHLVEATLAALFGFSGLQVNVSLQGGAFSIKIGPHTYRLDEIGNGFSHLLYLAIDIIVRPTKLLLVDEPETGLHPTMQRALLSFLSARAGGHLYFATHSVGLARDVADEVIGLHRAGGKLVVAPIRKLGSYAEWLGELSFSTWNDMGFKAVLLVEGPTELRSLPHLLRLLGIDVQVMLHSLGGNDFINKDSASMLGEYKRLNCPVYVLIDSEREFEGAALVEGRKTFVDACMALRYDIHVLHRRAFDNYLTDAAIGKSVRGDSRALGAFEKLVGEEPGWGKSRVPEIAYQMQWEDVENTDLGQFLQRLQRNACRVEPSDRAGAE